MTCQACSPSEARCIHGKPVDLGENEWRAKVEAAEAKVQACLEFLRTEMGWEYFRADFLHHDDEPKKRRSEENARILKNFLVECDDRARAAGVGR